MGSTIYCSTEHHNCEMLAREQGSVRRVGSHSHGHVKLAVWLVADEIYVSSRYFFNVNKSIIDYNLGSG